MKKDDKEKDKTNQGNKFDKIFKENISDHFIQLLSLKFKLNISSHKELTPKFQTTIEREVDFLRLVTDSNGQKSILHLEFQAQYDSELIFRIKEYDALIQRKYKLPVTTIVLYLGATNRKVQSKLPENMIFNQFYEFNFSSIAANYFIQSGIPGMVILGILSDMSELGTTETIKALVTQLKRTTSSNSKFNKFISQLLMLSQIRNLDSNLSQTLDSMTLNIDIRKNAMVAPILQEYEKKLEDQKSELEDQKSELEDQKSELEDQKSELEDQKSELEDQKSELEDQKSELEDQKSELEDQKSQLEDQIYNIVITMLKRNEHTVDEIAKITGTSLNYVITVKQKLDCE